MPIYEYECKKCKIIVGEYKKLEEYRDTIKCSQCGKRMKRVFSVHQVRNFEAQPLNLTITDRKTGDETQLVARNKQGLTDAINRYNDTPEAARTGKVAVLEQLAGREV